jgi:hypothetical protein
MSMRRADFAQLLIRATKWRVASRVMTAAPVAFRVE